MFFHKGVAVNSDKNVRFATDESFVEGSALAAVSFEPDRCNTSGEFGGGYLDPLPGVVGTAVVDGDNFYFVGRIIAGRNTFDCVGDMTTLVISRNQDRAGRELFICAGLTRPVAKHQYKSPQEGHYINTE